MQVHHLLTPAGEAARLRALAFLVHPSRYKHAISLYGRLSYARFAETTLLITNEDADDKLRLIACVDRARRPETELWLFGQWEVEDDAGIHRSEAGSMLRELFATIKSLPLPASMNAAAKDRGEDTEVDYSGLNRAAYGGHASNINILLCGAIHERTLPLLRSIDILSPEYVQTEIPFATYIFDTEHLAAASPLPEGLQWGRMELRHMDVVQARTLIPRQASTMAAIPSVGIFRKDDQHQPVAWGFIGVDGSLSTLHVEPEHRKQGLGVILTQKLLTDKMNSFFELEAPRIGHGHVAWENAASKALCGRVGGTATWSVHWLRVDLSRI